MEKGGEANDQYVIWVSKGGEKERVYYGTFTSKRKAELQQIKLYKTGEYSATGIMPKWAYDKHGFTKYADGGYMEDGGEISDDNRRYSYKGYEYSILKAEAYNSDTPDIKFNLYGAYIYKGKDKGSLVYIPANYETRSSILSRIIRAITELNRGTYKGMKLHSKRDLRGAGYDV
jgi:hypothetical protein